MKDLIRFQSDEALEDGFVYYIDPAAVTALAQEGDDYTIIYVPDQEFVVYGQVDEVAKIIKGTNKPLLG